MKDNFSLLFSFEDRTDIRIIMIDGVPWFVAKDVCECLALNNVSKACERLDNEDKTTITLSNTGSNYKTQILIVNESGLYTLILSSKKKEAKVFKKWLTSDVLPQIRKTGAYQSKSIAEGLDWEQIFAVLDERYAQIEDVQEFSQKTAQHLKHLYQEIAQLQKRSSEVSATDYVYVFHNRQNNEYKIGKSNAVSHRQKVLQMVEPNIYVYLIIPMQSSRHAHLWERTLQAEFESKRIHGEWFKLNESDLTMLRLLAKIMHLEM